MVHSVCLYNAASQGIHPRLQLNQAVPASFPKDKSSFQAKLAQIHVPDRGLGTGIPAYQHILHRLIRSRRQPNQQDIVIVIVIVLPCHQVIHLVGPVRGCIAGLYGKGAFQGAAPIHIIFTQKNLTVYLVHPCHHQSDSLFTSRPHTVYPEPAALRVRHLELPNLSGHIQVKGTHSLQHHLRLSGGTLGNHRKGVDTPLLKVIVRKGGLPCPHRHLHHGGACHRHLRILGNGIDGSGPRLHQIAVLPLRSHEGVSIHQRKCGLRGVFQQQVGSVGLALGKRPHGDTVILAQTHLVDLGILIAKIRKGGFSHGNEVLKVKAVPSRAGGGRHGVGVG